MPLKLGVSGFSEEEGHTVWHVSVSDGSRQWIVFKRFSEFESLDARLKTAGVHRLALPSKGTFGFRKMLKMQSFLDSRKQGLDLYMAHLASSVEAMDACAPLSEFLNKSGGTDGDTAADATWLHGSLEDTLSNEKALSSDAGWSTLLTQSARSQVVATISTTETSSTEATSLGAVETLAPPSKCSTEAAPVPASAAPRSNFQRVFIDYDSTLNPGQGNAPVTPERAQVLSSYLERWCGMGLELYVLTASNPDKKVEALRAAGLQGFFADVLSSSFPKQFASKGDFIDSFVKQEPNRCPRRQILLDDSIEAIQSVFQDAEGMPRSGGALAHTLRLPQHSLTGLVEEDLQLLTILIEEAGEDAPLTHRHTFEHRGCWTVDMDDSAEKCLLDMLPKESRGQVLHANSTEKCMEWLKGRPDLNELYAAARARADASPHAQPRPAARAPAKPSGITHQANVASANTKAPVPANVPTLKGKGRSKGPAASCSAKPQPLGFPSMMAEKAAKRSRLDAPALAIDLSALDSLVNRLEAVAARQEAAQPVLCTQAPPRPAGGPRVEGGALVVNLAGIENIVARLEQVAAHALA